MMKSKHARYPRLQQIITVCVILSLTIPSGLYAQVITEATFNPQHIELTLSPGEAHREEIRVVTGSPPVPRVDVLFLFDVTSSMRNVQNTAKSHALSIMARVHAVVPDAAFGVASFSDYPRSYDYAGYSATYGAPGDYPWSLDADITLNVETVTAAIRGLPYKDGSDVPENYSRALYEAARVSWRAGSRRIVILFGDAPVHDPTFHSVNFGADPGRDEIMGTADDLRLVDVAAELSELQIAVLPVYLSGINERAATGFEYMARQTGGMTYSAAVVSDLPDAIVSGVESSTAKIHNLYLSVPPEYADWIQSKPVQYADVGANQERVFRVLFQPPEDAVAGVHEFHLEVLADGALLGRVAVRINVIRGPVVYGRVTDGNGNALPGVLVELLSGKGTIVPRSPSIKATITTDAGEYRFDVPWPPEDLSLSRYRVRVTLSHYSHPFDPSHTPVFTVRYDGYNEASDPGIIVTPPFEIPDADAKIEQRLNFAEFEILPRGGYANVSADRINRLSDLASTYYRIYQAKEFSCSKLKICEFREPLEIQAFSSFVPPGEEEWKGSHFDPGTTPPIIRISPTQSWWRNSAAPKNVQWHEFGHFVMWHSYGSLLVEPGYNEHAGYANTSTYGSWLEGWAVFFACAVADSSDDDDPVPSSYPALSGYPGDPLANPNIEVNYKLWERFSDRPFWHRVEGLIESIERKETSFWANREEVAVAGILWDLYDSGEEALYVGSIPVSLSTDVVSIPPEIMWDTIVNYTPEEGVRGVRNVRALYKAFYSNSDLLESLSLSQEDIYWIFVDHGAHIDPLRYPDAFLPEAIGYSGGYPPHEKHLFRENTQGIPGAAIKIQVPGLLHTSNQSVTLAAYTEFAPPYEFYNSENRTVVDQATSVLYFEPPPPSYTATVRIEALWADGAQSDAWSIDTQHFWDMWTRTMDASGESMPEYVMEHTFRRPGEASTGGGFGLAVVLLLVGAGGMAIFVSTRKRRNASPHLVGLSGAWSGQRVPVPLAGLTIGRAAGNGLRLADPAVAPQHATLRYARGQWFLQDPGGASGLWVNGQAVAAAALRDGDRIRIGATEWLFRAR